MRQHKAKNETYSNVTPRQYPTIMKFEKIEEYGYESYCMIHMNLSKIFLEGKFAHVEKELQSSK